MTAAQHNGKERVSPKRMVYHLYLDALLQRVVMLQYLTLLDLLSMQATARIPAESDSGHACCRHPRGGILSIFMAQPSS